MVDVSVIIPVYNASDYLKEAIETILNQTLSDIEVLCVDDGSVDNSLDILKEIAEKDSRVQYFHQENRGGGAARNAALPHAKGKYIYFMDADDIVDTNALKECYEICEEKNLDFVIFRAKNYAEDTGEYFETDDYSMDELYDFVGDNVFNFHDLGDLIFKVSVTPWCKLYNREFVLSTGAQFAEGLIFHDNIFFWDVFLSAKRLFFYDKFLYTRRRHSASSTGAGDKRFISSITINNMIIQKFINHGLFEKYKKRLYDHKIYLTFHRYDTIQDQYKEFYYEHLKEDFTKMLSDERHDEFISLIQPNNKKRFEAVVYSRDFKEFELEIDNLMLSMEKNKLASKNKKLKNRVKKQKSLISRKPVSLFLKLKGN